MPQDDGVPVESDMHATGCLPRNLSLTCKRAIRCAYFSLDEVLDVVGTTAREYGSFWQSECLKMKDAPVECDAHAAGRLPRAKFHSKTLDGGLEFTDLEFYLQVGGSLDETSFGKASR